jgi:hypothetical protein
VDLLVPGGEHEDRQPPRWSVEIDDWPIDNNSHSRPYPVDGTLVNGYPSGRVFVFAGGTPLYVSNWANIGGPQPSIQIDDWPIDNHFFTTTYPVDGTNVRGGPSGNYYTVSNGVTTRVSSATNAVNVDDWAIANQLHAS